MIECKNTACSEHVWFFFLRHGHLALISNTHGTVGQICFLHTTCMFILIDLKRENRKKSLSKIMTRVIFTITSSIVTSEV